MDNQFNPNDWQGKRREQVEYSHNMAFITIIAAGVVALIGLILKLI